MTLSKNNYILIGVGVAVAAIFGIIIVVGGILDNLSENSIIDNSQPLPS